MAHQRRKLNLKERRPQGDGARQSAPWPVLVVDDEEDVHAMTGVLLRDFRFEGRTFEILSARSASEAAPLLAARPDIPVVLLDVVMETPQAGLDLVKDIRETLHNHRLRIILRTGQPGEAPERDVVVAYDINDYKSKAELTAQKLYTALVGALRAWRDINTIEGLNTELANINASLELKVAERTRELEAAKKRVEDALAKETEAKLRQRQFLSMVSHEFRTPLAVIDSAAQMLLLQVESPKDIILPRVNNIRGGVKRMIGLIDTCLADEQLESGTLTLREEAFDLGKVLAEAVEIHRAAFPRRRFDLQAAELPPAWGDPGLVALAVANLLSNAAKYSQQSERAIEVTARREGGQVRVAVRDHGIGIPPEDLPHVFERFHRAANARKLSGSGIGLNMVSQIVRLHGGEISVESAVGSGSVFTMGLRIAPA